MQDLRAAARTASARARRWGTKIRRGANLVPRRARPKFNKHAGILEWKNAIVLWVNIGGEGYENVFFQLAPPKDGGRCTFALKHRFRAGAGSKLAAALTAALPTLAEDDCSIELVVSSVDKSGKEGRRIGAATRRSGGTSAR